MEIEKELLAFLINCSETSLEDALLEHTAESRNLRKQLEEMLDLWLEETCRAELLAWFTDHREELVRALRDAANPFTLPNRRMMLRPSSVRRFRP